MRKGKKLQRKYRLHIQIISLFKDYTSRLNDLNPETLAKYHGLVIYANHEQISPSQEKALLDFTEEGKGFIPVHSASFCFQNSEKYIDLIGAQFQKLI